MEAVRSLADLLDLQTVDSEIDRLINDRETVPALAEYKKAHAEAQGLVQELSGIFEARDEKGELHRPSDRDLAAALRGLEGALTATLSEKEGPRAFLDTAARLVGRLGGAPATRPRPLIVEP